MNATELSLAFSLTSLTEPELQASLISTLNWIVRETKKTSSPSDRLMPYSKSLAARIRQALGQRKAVVEKKMFGGVAFLLNGNMLVGVWSDSLIVRLGSEQGKEALSEPHIKEFDVTGRPMKGWVMVEPDGVENDEPLGEWIRRASDFVVTLPAK